MELLILTFERSCTGRTVSTSRFCSQESTLTGNPDFNEIAYAVPLHFC
jgi:hypothetical protein